MANPPNDFNTNTAFNKYKGSYFNNDIDVSGGNIISRTGNLYLASNSNIYTSTNRIQFDDTYSFTNFLNNVNIYGQFKLTYDSIEYDVGVKIASIQDIYDNKIGTMFYNSTYDFNEFNNIYCSGQIQYEEGNGTHTDLVPIVLNNKFKLTNINYNGTTNTTTVYGLLALPDASINSSTINNTSFVDLTTAQTIFGIKSFNSPPVMSGASISAGTIPIAKVTGVAVNLNTAQSITSTKSYSVVQNFNNNIRLDGSLLLSLGTITITNATLQKLQFISTISSDIQTQLNTSNSNITTLTNNSVSLSALNNFSGATNTFTNNIRLDSSLLLNAGAITITNANLQKLQYISTISSDIQTQVTSLTNNSVSLSALNTFSGATNTFNSISFTGTLNTISTAVYSKIQYLSNITSDIKASLDTLNDLTSGFYRSATTGSYFFTSNLNTSGNFNTLTPYEIGNLTSTTEILQTAINNLKTKTDTTNINLALTTTNAADALERTEEISFSATPTPQTNITNKLVTEELQFTTNLNDITPTTFNYLANCSSNIQAQLNSKMDSLPGTIIQHVSAALQTLYPSKFLLCNGQEDSRTSILFTIIGTSYGIGNGFSTYNIPDYRCCFLRGYASARTINGVVYSPNLPNVIQEDTLEEHEHHSNLSGNYLRSGTNTNSGYFPGANKPNQSDFPSYTGGVTSTNRSSTETRPLNHSVYFYITC